MTQSSRTPGGADAGRARLRRLAMVWAGLTVLLVLRLVHVQAWRHDYYADKGQRQWIRELVIKAQRGRLLDRNRGILATDQPTVSYYADQGKVIDPEAVAIHFASVTGEPLWRVQDRLQVKGVKCNRHVGLARRLDGIDAAKAGSKDFAGVYTETEVRRGYPQGTLAAQVLGYTNIDNRGNDGLEFSLDETLAGKDGLARWVADGTGHLIPGSARVLEPARDGNSVVLTLDMSYQEILEQELTRTWESNRADGAMGLIMDPRSGEILAMANVPLFDPNRPNASDAASRRNRTVTDPYEPGSTFKIITLSGVLEHGLASTEELIDCGGGRLRLPNGHTIKDHHAYGTLSVRQVLEKSSNIGTIRLTQRLSRRDLYEHLRRFGFAARTGADLPGEAAGVLAGVHTWSDRTLETIAIGQEVSVTALQLAQAVCAVANGGMLLTPQIVKGVQRPDGTFEPMAPTPVRQVISPATAAKMRDMMTGVVEKGTGKLARIEGVSIGGKTGTAQKAANGAYGNSVVASFVGFLPAEDPQLLCLVVVDNPRLNAWGAQAAAPAFRQVVERVMQLPGGLSLPLQDPTPDENEKKEEDEAGKKLWTAVPDLRGMSPQVALYQADLRGLPVTFSGKGEIVVAQEPAPGARQGEELDAVSCVLGDTRPPASDEIPAELARQAVLLRKASPPPGAAVPAVDSIAATVAGPVAASAPAPTGRRAAAKATAAPSLRPEPGPRAGAASAPVGPGTPVGMGTRPAPGSPVAAGVSVSAGAAAAIDVGAAAAGAGLADRVAVAAKLASGSAIP
jgi:cell division protein FtsI (penicillin-binding protein 3)